MLATVGGAADAFGFQTHPEGEFLVPAACFTGLWLQTEQNAEAGFMPRPDVVKFLTAKGMKTSEEAALI